MNIITLFKNSTHTVAFNHDADCFEVFLLASPDAAIKRFPYAEAKGFERAVSFAMNLEYTQAKENAL